MTHPTPSNSRVRLAKAAASQSLTPAARRLHHAILRHFADTGTPPSAQHLATLAAHLRLPLDAARAELHDADVVLLDQTGEIRAAYPFSPTPTAHLVDLADGLTVYAMCAIDALGISAMLDQPVIVRSREPGTAHPITVHIDRDTATWHPHTTVVYAATTQECATSADATCHHINFFTTPDTAHTWADRHPDVTGTLLTQTDAIATAIAEFGAFLHIHRTRSPRPHVPL